MEIMERDMVEIQLGLISLRRTRINNWRTLKTVGNTALMNAMIFQMKRMTIDYHKIKRFSL